LELASAADRRTKLIAGESRQLEKWSEIGRRFNHVFELALHWMPGKH
jgi:hypothetical protein